MTRVELYWAAWAQFNPRGATAAEIAEIMADGKPPRREDYLEANFQCGNLKRAKMLRRSEGPAVMGRDRLGRPRAASRWVALPRETWEKIEPGIHRPKNAEFKQLMDEHASWLAEVAKQKALRELRKRIFGDPHETQQSRE